MDVWILAATLGWGVLLLLRAMIRGVKVGVCRVFDSCCVGFLTVEGLDGGVSWVSQVADLLLCDK